MTEKDDTEAVADAPTAADAQEQADFDAGFADTKPAPKAAKPDKPDAPEQIEPGAPAAPEYAQITTAELAELKAAVAKVASHEQQFSKAFGTLGNQQKLINAIQELQKQTPAGGKIEIPANAWAEMEQDFPELARMSRAAMEASLSGLTGTGGGFDPAKVEEVANRAAEAASARQRALSEMEDLQDAHPDWRTIVGAIDASTTQPDPNNAFRRWLATKDTAYQTRINASTSAAVIGRAINAFQADTRTAPRPATGTPRESARADRIRNALQPRGDNAAAEVGGRSDDEEAFLAGFNSR